MGRVHSSQLSRENRVRIRSVSAALILSSIGSTLTAQASSCGQGGGIAPNVAYEIRSMMTPVNSVRDSLKLPLVSGSEVVVVSDTAVCNRVRQALDSMITATTPDAINLGPRPIYAIRIGNHYAAINPRSQIGEFVPVFFFNERFTYLSLLAF